MADITITQAHAMDTGAARAAAQKVADEMVEKYDMEVSWLGEVLHFQRSGASGTLTLLEHRAVLEVTLGFLLKSFAPMIEEKVTRNMQKVFA
ncbi:MAG: polyhydroxyalkanoic acid system family protein [Janthinobacterium lividum]